MSSKSGPDEVRGTRARKLQALVTLLGDVQELGEKPTFVEAFRRAFTWP
jgi:hypothetical protein